MNVPRFLRLALGAVLLSALAPVLALGHSEAETAACRKWAGFLAPVDSPGHRQYAPSREIDIQHLALDVTPDFTRRRVAVVTTLTFRPIALPLTVLRLNAVRLAIDEVTATAPVQAWQSEDEFLVVTFATPLPPDGEVTLTVRSQAEPKRGLYFRTPELGYRPEDMHLFTQGQAIEARHWYPCFDAPNEKFTSEITCHVPEGMTVLSNGRRVSSQPSPAAGLVAVRWHQEQPHANYLISLVAGHFRTLEDRLGDLPLAFHTPVSQFAEAELSFRYTKEAIAFFEQETGVKYPWAKYDQVCVNDFVAGGMENTSITTLTDGTLFSAAHENLRSSVSLMAHELAHQWFGDLTTCKDWTHLWLNEGFATYYDHLFNGHLNGRDALLYGLFEDARGFLDTPDDTRPIADRTFDDPMQQFGFHAYQKGSWVLHMLRSQLGDDLYRRAITTFLQRHRFGNVVTEDLNRILEELSGRSWDQFFDQWVYHAHHPELEIAYHWNESEKLATLNVRQTQALSDKVLLFRFPLTVRFRGPQGNDDRTVEVRRVAEDFRFSLPSAPTLVRIDPNLTILAKINFTPPASTLPLQLTNREDVIGRLLAVRLVGRSRDQSAVDQLRSVLNADPFYGVRLEAARALRALRTDAALDALLASRAQADARVRRQVYSDLAGFYRERVLTALLEAWPQETNPDIRAVLLRGLGAYARPPVQDILLQALDLPSFRNEVTDAAIGAIRSQDDPVYLKPLQSCLLRRAAEFTPHGYAHALGVLARLARHEPDRTPVREFLTQQLDHRRDSVRHAALAALGTLGDPKAAAVLSTYLEGDDESPERSVAQNAFNQLESDRPPDALRNLRNELLDVQRANNDLRQQVDDLRQRLESTPPPPPPPPPPSSATPPAKKPSLKPPAPPNKGPR